jgi:hypothetical protein
VILVGPCSPKPAAFGPKPYPGPFGFAPSVADVWAEWAPTEALGCRYDGGHAPEDAIALGATPVVWFPRTLAGNGGALPTDAMVRGLGQSLDQRVRGPLGQPILFIIRFVEWNTDTYLPHTDPAGIAALAQHYIDLLRESCGEDRMVVSFDIYATAFIKPAALLAMVPHGAQLCGLDHYQAGQLDTTRPEGAAAAAFAAGCNRPVVTLESGIFPCAVNGVELPEAVPHAKALLKFWIEHKVRVALVCSHDWTAKPPFWGDGTLEHAPNALAVLKAGLAQIGAVAGPLQVGGLTETLAKLTGAVAA